MSMDLVAHNANDPRYGAFHATVWIWRPLWQYVADVFPDLADLVSKTLGSDAANYNDAAGLTAHDAYSLGERIATAVANGDAQTYIDRRNERIANLPRHECWICHGTGIRTDEVGRHFGLHDQILEPEIAAIVGRAFGSCNSCRGLGTLADPMSDYKLPLHALTAFADFLRHSGGFSIY